MEKRVLIVRKNPPDKQHPSKKTKKVGKFKIHYLYGNAFKVQNMNIMVKTQLAKGQTANMVIFDDEKRDIKWREDEMKKAMKNLAYDQKIIPLHTEFRFTGESDMQCQYERNIITVKALGSKSKKEVEDFYKSCSIPSSSEDTTSCDGCPTACLLTQ